MGLNLIKKIAIMMIPREFDEANNERKKRINQTALKTATKLNVRILSFFKDIDNNHSLTDKQKDAIKAKTLNNLNKQQKL